MKKLINTNKNDEQIITNLIPFLPRKKPNIKVNILEKKGKKTNNKYIYGVCGW